VYHLNLVIVQKIRSLTRKDILGSIEFEIFTENEKHNMNLKYFNATEDSTEYRKIFDEEWARKEANNFDAIGIDTDIQNERARILEEIRLAGVKPKQNVGRKERVIDENKKVVQAAQMPITKKSNSKQTQSKINILKSKIIKTITIAKKKR
jgi:hypothetical protein